VRDREKKQRKRKIGNRREESEREKVGKRGKRISRARRLGQSKGLAIDDVQGCSRASSKWAKGARNRMAIGQRRLKQEAAKGKTLKLM
jgi:hypothetical protein